MKKVVLFKSESEDYRKTFGEKELETVFVEPLQFSQVSGAQLAARLLSAEYCALVLTSPRAVAACAACWDAARAALWSARRVYCVGELSRRQIKLSLGLEALGENCGNADKLARLIVSENRRGSRFLFPCGNLRSELLPSVLDDAGISVDALTVYETEENVNLRRDLTVLNSEHEPCGLVFFSPSGCEYVHRQLQTFANGLSQLPHFAIGNSTAHKIENLGIEIAGVASAPRPDSLAETVHKYFQTVQSYR